MKKIIYKDINGKEHEVNQENLIHAPKLIWNTFILNTISKMKTKYIIYKLHSRYIGYQHNKFYNSIVKSKVYFGYKLLK